jgi:Flp pilus assembly protein TadG
MNQLAALRRRVPDLGSAAVEFAVLAPGLLLLTILILVGGRIVLAGGSVEQVAASAARQASLARDPATADRLARQEAARSLAEQHLQCTSLTVSVDPAGFRTPVGQPAAVSVDVICRVRLADLPGTGLDASKAVRGHAISTLDQYRARQVAP